jgi:hypothetical protein
MWVSVFDTKRATYMSWIKLDQVGFCEHGIGLAGSVEDGEYLDRMRDF